MKKLQFINRDHGNKGNLIQDLLSDTTNKYAFVSKAKMALEYLDIEFYDYIGVLLKQIGIKNPHITREGEVNVRMDAIIIDDAETIPIEIKSPREVKEINVKAIRQALENKIVLLSRKFYPTNLCTTSLAIGFEYPNNRSDIYELIVDIKKAFNFNIGIIDINDLLSLVYDIQIEGNKLDMEYFNNFSGRFDYEKAFV